MTTADRFIELKSVPMGRMGRRVAAELIYAMELSKIYDGKHDAPIERATNHLYEAYKRQGVISDSDAGAAEDMLLSIREDARAYTMHCVAHAHIDMNWTWGYSETVNLTLDTFRTMLRMMEEYPQFTFSQSQASVYEIAEKYDPDMFAQIAQRVREGRWEVTASTWTETDKNMPSGESLSRHILYTKRYFKEKFGLDSSELQLDFEPDTFGHSAQIPEICAGGVKYYYHCRGAQRNDIYRYRAMSGAELLCYHDPLWYNMHVDEQAFVHLPGFCAANGVHDAMYVYGVGDHGGGPTRRDIEMLIDMQGWPIAPVIKFSRYHDFFRTLEPLRGQFPVVDKELNYIFTGCYSSQSRIKAANRLAEDRLYEAEALSAFSHACAAGRDETGEFAEAWKRVLFNQFHDILPRLLRA